MGRRYTEDNTNVFRQKVTRKGYRPPNQWDSNDTGNEYETVEFYGPYLTRNVGGNPWLHGTDKTMLIEVQKLSTTEHGLEWLTEKSKLIENDAS